MLVTTPGTAPLRQGQRVFRISGSGVHDGPDWPFTITGMRTRASTGEIGRFAISRGFNDVDCTGSAPLRLGLLKGVAQVSAQLGLTHWCVLMEHTLLCFLHGSAVQFQLLGPAIEHGGRLCQPAWAGIDALLTRLRGERPALWDYLTEGGSLCGRRRSKSPPSELPETFKRRRPAPPAGAAPAWLLRRRRTARRSGH